MISTHSWRRWRADSTSLLGRTRFFRATTNFTISRGRSFHVLSRVSFIQSTRRRALQKEFTRRAVEASGRFRPGGPVRSFGSTPTQETGDVAQSSGEVSWYHRRASPRSDDSSDEEDRQGVHGFYGRRDRKNDDDSVRLRKRREEILRGLPTYVRFITIGDNKVLVYPIVHGNSRRTMIHARESQSSGAKAKEGGCGTSSEASQLIRLLAPTTVFFSVDPPADPSTLGSPTITPSSSSYQETGGIPLRNGAFRHSRLHYGSVGYLPNIHGGKSTKAWGSEHSREADREER